MGRGKIEIKKIENQTNRQVTYSKRRNGIFKKANELSLLCDAKISLIMVSSSGKVHNHTSGGFTTKQMYEMYQNSKNTDIWKAKYEKMKEELRALEECNGDLRKQIWNRKGVNLEGLSIKELQVLEVELTSTLDAIHLKSLHALKNVTSNKKKKVTHQEQRHTLLEQSELQYGILESEPDYDSTITVVAGAPSEYPAKLLHLLRSRDINHLRQVQPEGDGRVLSFSEVRDLLYLLGEDTSRHENYN